ncbi:hypothetical protein Acsp06_20740 [Actinomycetospora sp. NBRC 106375]|uniref:DUF2332 domain-containing protein n=1 Tax=Actinomycetospora sp. NBRC 106375 TaxID=3032207 RepID=UPI0024A4B5D4|nr:DUF2332 domain-containing protein [Actinomycetospora sp. NBRC 106375]GLZ45889.1 hypothetical protein Acsp06_20740 [Actinomycetospora sp. NBRC 106375]
MIGHELHRGVAENYRRFGLREARGRSPLYEALTLGVADDPSLQAFLDELPPGKRQPNLLLATVRFLAGVQPDYAAFRDVVLDRRDEVAATMLARRTQTNEPARCATLLPALAQIEGPLALLEVGASAGLCLYPDRYGYRFPPTEVVLPGEPMLTCEVRGPAPLPTVPPTVVWRAGIDLNPLDVADPDDLRWLHCLIWPGEEGRAERLDAAAAVARADPPRIVRGDLVDDLPALAAEAPPDATLVVVHSAVLAYVPAERRAAFAEVVARLGAVWLGNESTTVLADLPTPPPTDLPAPPPGPTPSLLVRDGHRPLAWVDGHGTWLEWID